MKKLAVLALLIFLGGPSAGLEAKDGKSPEEIEQVLNKLRSKARFPDYP